jgi:muconolactone delta-isomerase
MCWRSSAPSATRASVRVDVNQAWSELEAMRGIAALEAGGIDLIEQPVKRRQPRRAGAPGAALRRRHHGRRGAAWSRRRLATRPQRWRPTCSPSRSPSPAAWFPALQVATVAQLAGIGLYGGTMLEGGVGTAATAHLCATFADLSWDTELFGPLLLTQEVLREPLVYRDFMLQVPTGPGLGVEVDMDKLQPHAPQTIKRGDPMLFHVRWMSAACRTRCRRSRPRTQGASKRRWRTACRKKGKWRHLWRIAGQYANVSIFDVDSVDELHALLMSLPLFPYMQIEVTALCRHPVVDPRQATCNPPPPTNIRRRQANESRRHRPLAKNWIVDAADRPVNPRVQQVVLRLVGDLCKAIEDLDISPPNSGKASSTCRRRRRNELGLLTPAWAWSASSTSAPTKPKRAGLEGGTPRTIEGPLYVAGAPESVGFARLDDGTEASRPKCCSCRAPCSTRRQAAAEREGRSLARQPARATTPSSTPDPVADFNLRRTIVTDAEGRYQFRSIMPGLRLPAGRHHPALLNRLGRHGQRPAHIHFFVSAPATAS